MSDPNNLKWFEKLRINSWEIEILIVACILAALFNIPSIPEDRVAALLVSSHADQGWTLEGSDSIWIITGGVKIFMYLGMIFFISMAKITFSSYILFRGFWVAVIGLSSVFTKGIDKKRLNFSTYFNKIIPGTNFNTYILRLDNICSSIFSLGFLTTFYVISILFYLSLVIFFIALGEYFMIEIFGPGSLSQDVYSIFFMIFFVIGLIFFLDILFIGIVKRIKWKVFSYPYSKLYKFLRICTFFFLYESVYYLFISNVKSRVILLCWLLLAVFLSFGFISKKADGYLSFPSNDFSTFLAYDNALELRVKAFMSKSYYEDRLLAGTTNFSSTPFPFINSEIISDSYLKLYIPFHPYIHSSIDSACDLTTPSRSWKIKVYGSWYFEKLINCINSQYAIYIDNDTIVTDFSFYNYSASVDDKDISIKTFFMPIPVNKYQDGKHIITIEKLFYEGYGEVPDSVSNGYYYEVDQSKFVKGSDSLVHIPFYIYR